MIALIGSVLAMSLLGSPHCAAMCGGFVCVAVGQQRGRRGWVAALAYNAGRLVSYVTLGTIAGVAGAGLDRLGFSAGVARASAVVAGALMIVWAGAMVVRARRATSGPPRFLGPLRRVMAAALRAVEAQPPVIRAGVVGLVTTLLPCGFLYAYVTVAAGTGSAFAGAVTMATFWLGTLPVMATFGLAAGRLLRPLQRRLPAWTAASWMVIGLLTITGKLHAGGTPQHCAGCATSPAASTAASAHAGHGAR